MAFFAVGRFRGNVDEQAFFTFQGNPNAETYPDAMWDGDKRSPVRRVVWVRSRGDAAAYLVAAALSPLALAAGLLLAAADLNGFLTLLIFCFVILPPMLYILSLVEEAADREGHPYQGWWALKAQVWLHAGGAVGQALRGLRTSVQGRHEV